MIRQQPFSRDDVYPSWFTNRIQDRIAPLVQLRLEQTNATTIQVTAGANDEAASLNIEGNWRFVEAPVPRAHPGGAAGTYLIFATASDQVIVNSPDPNTDLSDYAFDLAIVSSGSTPSIDPGVVDVFRRVGSLTWDGSAITSFTQEVGVHMPAGSIRNAQVAADAAIEEGKLALASDAAAGTPSRRTLGTSATQAAAGNDPRFPAGADIVAADIAAALKPSGTAAAGTEALRALGTSATQAAAGNDPRFPAGADIEIGDISAAFYTAVAHSGDIKMSVASGDLGWLFCDGSSKLRTDYPSLFATIGTQYGAADGTHFNVPDLRGRFPLGTSGAHPMAQTGGAETVSLGTPEMPAHTHTGPSHSHTSAAHVHARGAHTHDPPSSAHYLVDGGGVHWAYGSSTPTGADISLANPPSTGSGGSDTGSTTPSDTGAAGTGATGSQGSGTAHNNMPPFIVVQFFIKV